MSIAASFSITVISQWASEGSVPTEETLRVEGTDLSSAVTVPITLRHISTKSADVRLSTTSVKLTPEAPSALIQIQILDDALDEPDEAFGIKLGAVRGHQVEMAEVEIMILDDDVPPTVEDIESKMGLLGMSFNFSANVYGSGTLSLQWRKNGKPIPGAKALTLKLPKVQMSDAGIYELEVSNATGKVVSNKAALVVCDPQRRWHAGKLGQSVVLTAVVATAGPCLFQWYKNDEPVVDDTGTAPRIQGAATRSLTLKQAAVQDAGTYSCQISLPGLDSVRSDFLLHFDINPPQLAPLVFPTGAVGVSYEYSVPLLIDSGSPASFASLDLPAGLAIDEHTGIISGIPTEGVTDRLVTITVCNDGGSDSHQALLSITALPKGMVGSFQGWLATTTYDDPRLAVISKGARFEMITTANGFFTGKIIAATTLPFSGRWQEIETLSQVSKYATSLEVSVPNGWPLSLKLAQSIEDETLEGTLGLDLGGYDLQAWKNVWSASQTPQAYLGQWNVLLESSHEVTQSAPLGSGYAMFRVTTSGLFVLTGRLPDGQAITSSGFLGPDGQVLLFQMLYGNRGSVGAMIRLLAAAEGALSSVSTEDSRSTWIRPDKVTAKDRLYAQGFITSFNIVGGLYKPTQPGAVFMNYRELPLNAVLSFIGGDVEVASQSLSNPFTLTPSNTAVMPPGAANPVGASFSFNAATGLFSGSFKVTHPDPTKPAVFNNDGVETHPQGVFTRTASFQGLAAQGSRTSKSLKGGGYFIISEPMNPESDPPITAANAQLLSGQVDVSANPQLEGNLPVATLSAPDLRMYEAGSPTVTVSITLTEVFAKRRVMPITILHGTTSAADVRLSASSVTFEPDVLQAAVTLIISDDIEDELGETFTIELGDGVGYELDVGSLNMTIEDDDTKPFALNALRPSVSKLGSPISLEAQIDGDEPLFIQWFKDGEVLPSMVGPSLYITSSSLADGGRYHIVASNRSGTLTMPATEVVVIGESQVVTVTENSDLRLTLPYAPLQANLSFQWHTSAGEMLTDSTGNKPKYSGTTTASPLIRNYDPLNDGAEFFICNVRHVESANPDDLVDCYLIIEVVTLPPKLSVQALPNGRVSENYFYPVQFETPSTGEAWPAVFKATGLPKGLSIDPKSGIIRGVPLEQVTARAVTVKVSNNLGSDSKTLPLTISSIDSQVTGMYLGWVSRATENLPVKGWDHAELGGRLDMTITSNGVCSGKITGATRMYSFSSNVIRDGDTDNFLNTYRCEVVFPVKGSAALILNLYFDTTTQLLSGSFGPAGGEALPLSGWRQTWSPSNRATNYIGTYHFLLQASSIGNGGAGPENSGYGRVMVPVFGNFNIQGRLMDGTPFLCSSFLGPQGEIMLYQKLYTQPGSLLGECQVAENNLGVRTIKEGAGGISLYKPAQTSKAERLYRNGFFIDAMSLTGGIYTPPSKGQIALDLPDQEENAVLAGDYIGQVFRLRASGSGTLTPAAGNPQNFTFALNPTTGEFSGGFSVFSPDPVILGRLTTRKATYYGLITPIRNEGICIIPDLPDATADPPTTAANVPWLTTTISLSGN